MSAQITVQDVLTL